MTDIAITEEHGWPSTVLNLNALDYESRFGKHLLITLHHVGPGYSGTHSFRLHGDGLRQMADACLGQLEQGDEEVKP